MDRTERTRSYRRTLAIAIGVSAAAHILAVVWIRLTVPVLAERDGARTLRVLDLPDAWEDAAIEVVPLETALATVAGEATAGSSAPAAAGDSPDPGSAGADAAVAAVEPLDPLPGVAPGTPALTLELADATPVMDVALARSNRGVVLRAGAGAAGSDGLHFIATSDAARDAERERGGNGPGGPGIGVGVVGGGGHCPAWGGIPFINPVGPTGSLPTTGRGRGILGLRPPGGEAINRFAPGIGIGGR